MTELTRKRCSRCKQEKNTDEFNKCSSKKDGLQSLCKTCKKHDYQENKSHYINKQKERYTNNKDVILARQKDYYIKNKDIINKKQKIYYQNNIEKYRLANSLWGKLNRHKSNAISKRYRENNKIKIYAHTALMRSKRNKRFPKWANKNKISLFYKLAACLTRITGIKHEVDHIIPLQGKNVSGLHIENNLQVITSEENKSKSNKFDSCNRGLL